MPADDDRQFEAFIPIVDHQRGADGKRFIVVRRELERPQLGLFPHNSDEVEDTFNPSHASAFQRRSARSSSSKRDIFNSAHCQSQVISALTSSP